MLLHYEGFPTQDLEKASHSDFPRLWRLAAERALSGKAKVQEALTVGFLLRGGAGVGVGRGVNKQK